MNLIINNRIISKCIAIFLLVITILNTLVPITVQAVNMFGKDITLQYEWVANEDYLKYALYSPSTVNESEALPLIVWLHGQGDGYLSQDDFMSIGLPAVLNNWKLEGFSAYVLCPQAGGSRTMVP